MKALFDNIIFARQKYGGISVVWYELMKRIINDDVDSHFIDFLPSENIMRRQLSIPEEMSRRANPRFRKVTKYLPVLYCSKEKFIFHSSYFRTCLSPKAINITTVHDFTNEYFQKGAGARKDRRIKDRAIRHSDYIICISENTKKDLLHFHPHFPKEKIRVIYNGVSEEYHPSDETMEWNYTIPQYTYLLYVGERGGYKNFDFVVNILRQYDMNLIITGNPLNDDEAKELESIKGQYLYAGRVNAEQLNVLYNKAEALIYPSSYEGFGLPVIEAQRAGCPVIALKASSIPEIIGKTPLLLERLSIEEAISKIRMLSDKDIRNTIIQEGLKNSSRFSWDRTFAQTKALYREALGESSFQ